MKTKAIIRIIATAFAAVTILGATTACSKKDDQGSSRETHTNLAESTRKSEKPEIQTESTAVSSETKPVTEDTIILRLDGMTTEEIIKDLWNTMNVKTGTKSVDYYENINMDGCRTFSKKDDDFSWLFYEGSSDTTCYISRISVFSGFKCDPIFEGPGDITLELHIEDKDFAFEVAQAIADKIQSEDFAIRTDMKSSEDSWNVSFQRDRQMCMLQVHHIGDYVIFFDFPIDGN